MRFTIPEDNTMSSIPGNSGLPPKVTKGKTPVRPPNTVGKLASNSGPSGGRSGLGNTGTTDGPAGTHVKGFKGSPPATSASNGNKSVRDKSNPYRVSTEAFVPGMAGGGKK